jgi:hypothetical protein
MTSMFEALTTLTTGLLLPCSFILLCTRWWHSTCSGLLGPPYTLRYKQSAPTWGIQRSCLMLATGINSNFRADRVSVRMPLFCFVLWRGAHGDDSTSLKSRECAIFTYQSPNGLAPPPDHRPPLPFNSIILSGNGRLHPGKQR